MKKIIIPIPSYGCDPSEVGIPWKVLNDSNCELIFATPDGKKGAGDLRMLSGDNLGIWKSLLKARQDAISAFKEVEKSASFCNPIKYEDIQENDFDGILLPGGHDKRVKEYLESKVLQNVVVAFFKTEKPVAAVCHGVVLAARSIVQETGKSVLHGYKTTALLKTQELAAYHLTRAWLKDYYLTYPGKTVEDEVLSVLSDKKDFLKGPNPLFRDDEDHLGRGFCVRDRNYLSARWPGDIYNFSFEFVKMLFAK